MKGFDNCIGFMKRAWQTAAIAILFVMSFSLVGCSGSSSTGGKITPGSEILPVTKKIEETSTQANTDQIALTGVLTLIDTDSKKMHYLDISNGTEYEVAYSGGTDIENKYDTVITTAKMKMGAIYDVTCNRSGTAVTIFESKTAWEVQGLTGFSANETDRVATLNSKTYKYDKNAIILSGTDRLEANEVMKQDEVTVYGMDKSVYSVRVDKGHGYMKLTGTDEFIGGYVDVGDTMVNVVTKDMLVTVPEGEYKVSIQNASNTLSGSKTVKVERDRDVTVDFAEYRTEATMNGLVEFSVTPAGAVMYIDGTQVDYSQPISLDYGKHTVILKQNNYLSYEETFYVKQSYEKKIIDMTISSSTSASGSTGSTSASGTTATVSGTAQATTKSGTASATSADAGSTVKDLTEGYYINIKGPEGAAVYINSSYVGMAPVTIEKKSGTMVVALTMAGHQTKSYSIEVPNATGDLNYTFPELEQTTGGESTVSAIVSATTETTAAN